MRPHTLPLFAVVLLLAGCQNHHQDLFPPDSETRAPVRFADAQAASAARAHATLYPQHFDQADLNSLGLAKLELVFQGDPPASPLTIYLDVPKDDGLWDARSTSVSQYLQTRGLQPSQFTLKPGPNPNVMTPAAPNLKRLPKTESGSVDAAGGQASPPSGGMGQTPNSQQ